MKKETTIQVFIYKDTTTSQYEGDNNLSLITLPVDFIISYASKNNDYKTFEEWENNYTADETQDLFDMVIKNNIKYELTDYNY